MPRFVSSLLTAVFAATTAQAGKLDYRRELQPILSEHCFHCHGQDEKTREGGLRLDVREAALKGGESDGAAIVPGKPEASALLARIAAHDDDVMPPTKSKNPVKAADLEKLRQWITEGAEYAQHWAFDAPVKAALPAGEHPVDALVKARLLEEKLTFSPPAESHVLVRRLYLDLIGLPPSPAEVDSFLQAYQRNAAQAVSEVIETLLKSPHYGEKWARHWLDVARYSDSNGYEKDLPREQWAWRDWVIEAFNQDMPYDRFVTEQIAGDLLPQRTQAQLVATGFLRNGLVNEEGAIVPEQFRMEGQFDRMDCVGKAVLGLSLQCAQCHSHKFDPISHDEYFGIFAFLNNVHEAKSWVHTPEQQAQIRKIHTGIRAVIESVKKTTPDWVAKLSAWEKERLTKEASWQVLDTEDQTWVGGLNHPTELADKSVLVLGHPSSTGEMYVIAKPQMQALTGVRLEALLHGDLPFGGPGRSYWGTFAITEMKVESQLPGSEKWEVVKLKSATADFAEPEHVLEPFFDYKRRAQKPNRRVGPASFLVDGNGDTGWRADRGPGRRNQESAVVVQFDQPLTLPQGAQLKVTLTLNHGGDNSGQDNAQLGRMRFSVTRSPQPVATPYDHAAALALAKPASERREDEQERLFIAWLRTTPAFKKQVTEMETLWKTYPEAPTSVLHLTARDPIDPRVTALLDRGAWDKPKHEVKAHTPAALHPMKDARRDRLAFAEWLADKRSPLTARVAVNRVWQALFGQGLVETPEDFGTRTLPPVHQALLDWLAVDFMEHGWSHRHLIRTLVTSATYQQSSRLTPALAERDPRNVLLARGPRFRAEAEVVRDVALRVSGLLTPKVGGPSVFPPVPQSVLDYNYFKPDYWVPATDEQRYRRGLYVFRKRSMPDPLLSSFDAPNSDFACARRVRSNTPLSALASLNETIFVEAAQALAQRILREGGAEDRARADYAYRLCTARPIRPAEAAQIQQLLDQTRARLRKGELKANSIAFSAQTQLDALPADATPNDLAAWTLVSRVLLNLDETLTKN